MKKLSVIFLGTMAGFLTGSNWLPAFIGFLIYLQVEKIRNGAPVRDWDRFFLIRSMAALLTAIARADGIYSKTELAYIKNFLRYYFQMTDKEFSWYLQDLKYFAFQPSIPVKKFIQHMNRWAHRHEKVFFLHCACELCAAQTVIHPQQKKLVNSIGNALGISSGEMEKIWEKYQKVANKYFQILGVRPDTPLEEIKKRYYDLARFFHPDRFRHRSLEEQRFAEQKMQLINEAWREILKARQVRN